MKILVLGKYYPPYCGGIETLTRIWCEGFVARGATVEAVVAHDRPRSVRETVRGVAIERCARFGNPLSTPLCPSYLSRARRSCDLIQLHAPNPLADVSMLLARRHVPLVVTWHSEIIRQARLMTLYRPLLHWVLRRASRVVVATPPQIEHSAVLPAFRSKCVVIPFGLDLARFEAAPVRAAAIDEARAAAGGRPILLNIGRLVGYKGQRFLIESLRDLDAVVWLVGGGPLRAELEALAAAIGVSDRVRFWGEVPDNLLPLLLHACDVFVLSSITPNEAFGLVQVEAMACGKPVVCCQLNSGVPYVNQDGVTGFVVPPENAPALAAAARRLLVDPDLARRMGEAGRLRARREFSVDAMIGRYWNLFRELAGGGLPG